MRNWYENQIRKQVVDSFYNKNYLMNLNRIVHDRSADEVLLELFLKFQDKIPYLPLDMSKYTDRIFSKYLETGDPYWLIVFKADWSARIDDLVEKCATDNDPAAVCVFYRNNNMDKERLWEVVEKTGYYRLLDRSKYDWSDKKEMLWESFKKTFNVGILSFSKLDWSDKKEELWSIANQPGKMILLMNNGKGLDWSDKSEQLWAFAKQNLEFIKEFSHLSGIDWSDKKDEAWEIFESTGLSYVLDIGRNVDWSDKKEQLWNYFLKTKNPFLLQNKCIDWSDKKEDIWKIFLETDSYKSSYKHRDFYRKCIKEAGIPEPKDDKFFFEYMQKKEKLWWGNTTGRVEYLRGLGIDWSDRKDEILEQARKTRDWQLLELYGTVDWSDKSDKIWKIFQEEKDFSILLSSGIDWSDKKDLIIGTYASMDSQIKSIIDDVRQKYNVTNDVAMFGDLYFNSAPHWKIESTESEMQIQLKRDFLKSILQRLDHLGVLRVLVESEIGSLEQMLIRFSSTRKRPDLKGIMTNNKSNADIDVQNYSDHINHLYSSIDSFSPIELNAYLIFYINKLTKLNEVSIYEKALCGFEYDIAKEEAISNGQTSPELDAYKNKRNNSQEGGDKLVKTLYALRKEYNAIKSRINEEKETSPYPIIQKSEGIHPFNEFLSYWKKGRNQESGEIKAHSDVKEMEDYYTFFNNSIRDLTNDGFDLDDITNVFIYANNAIDFQNKLYSLKHVLLQQLIVYFQQPEHKEELDIRFQRGNKSSTDKHKSDILYVFMNSYPYPQSFHTDLSELIGLDDSMEVDPKSVLSKYCGKINNYFIAPYTEEDRDTVYKELGIEHPQSDVRYANTVFYQMMLLLKDGFSVSRDNYEVLFDANGLKSLEALRGETTAPNSPVTLTGVLEAGNDIRQAIAEQIIVSEDSEERGQYEE